MQMIDIVVLEDPQCKYLFGKIDVIISTLSSHSRIRFHAFDPDSTSY